MVFQREGTYPPPPFHANIQTAMQTATLVDLSQQAWRQANECYNANASLHTPGRKWKGFKILRQDGKRNQNKNRTWKQKEHGCS